MKKLYISVIVILILITSSLFAQDNPYIGMTANEFRKTLPGVLPEELVFNRDLYMHEMMHNIEGVWSFGFSGNVLDVADYIGESKINSEEDFNRWVESAKLIVDDYSKTYGQPVTYEKGNNKYSERNNRGYENRIGKREVFEEAVWKTNSMRIVLSCDYRSNYYNAFNENIPSGPPEWYSYSFQINYFLLPDMKAVKFDEPGRFYLGMDVKDFAKVFPNLFPTGVNFSGQWQREQDLYGVKGMWGYTFKDGILKWVNFQKYIDEINEENFNLCLTATKQIIKDCTDSYGNPDLNLTGNTKFADPSENMHQGYKVLEARWENYKGIKIKVEFVFTGGKSGYHFLVVMNYFDKDYPYYD